MSWIRLPRSLTIPLALSNKIISISKLAMKRQASSSKRKEQAGSSTTAAAGLPHAAVTEAKKRKAGGQQDFDEFMQRIEKQRIDEGDASSFMFHTSRCKSLSQEDALQKGPKAILYYMFRDQRVQDNWALLYAQRVALKEKVPLIVVFCLLPKFLDATLRMFGFMLKGLEHVRTELHALNIPFEFLFGEPKEVIPELIKKYDIGAIITDFMPLHFPQKLVKELVEVIPDDVPVCQVDAHNIVPVWVASNKLEYSARTIRPKITNLLEKYLTEYPAVISHPHNKLIDLSSLPNPFNDWDKLINYLQIDKTVKEVAWAKPGTTEAFRLLKKFLDTKLKFFSEKRNDPNEDVSSNLSPYFHFGQISVARCILEVKRLPGGPGSASFVEEAVIRRELSDNFCFYNENYDRLEGASDWARKTLNDHRKDKRNPVYSLKELEESLTYDDLWNSSQRQMVQEGKMHGYVRMYWAKKILEWSESPEKALEAAIYLNDKYSLDGRDPNGYVGCMWSIAGIHDQGWREREIFGKIRFMNYEGCKRKFSIPNYVAKYPVPTTRVKLNLTETKVKKKIAKN